MSPQDSYNVWIRWQFNTSATLWKGCNVNCHAFQVKELLTVRVKKTQKLKQTSGPQLVKPSNEYFNCFNKNWFSSQNFSRCGGQILALKKGKYPEFYLQDTHESPRDPLSQRAAHMQLCQKLEIPLPSWYLIFNLKMLKMASWDIRKARVTSEISHDAAFWNQDAK